MNINNIKELKDDTKDKDKRREHKKLQIIALKLAGKAVVGKLKTSDVDQLKIFYKKYFERWPDAAKENHVNNQLKKMYIIAK